MNSNNVSIFAQILQLFPKKDFFKEVEKTGAEFKTKGFSSWDQFVSMLFCQIGKANSLREICGGLASSAGKLNHLGMAEAPSKSTLAHANKNRPWELFEGVFYQLLEKCEQLTAKTKRKFKFKNPLFSIDGSIIDLCLSMYDWAKYRTAKGAIKLHMVLDHDGYLPTFLNVTEGKVHEINVARTLRFPKDSIIAMDRGYIDYLFFANLNDAGVFFVTREKSNAKYLVVEERVIPKIGNIRKDQLIKLEGYYSKEKYPHLLRRIEVSIEEKQQTITLLTNHLNFGPTTIASIYKERWQIETFFKAIKQNLKIKTFVGTSKNALLTQIWTAFIAILVLKYLKMLSQFEWSLSNLVAMLRFNLLVYKDLWVWLNNPYQPPPEPDIKQLYLAF